MKRSPTPRPRRIRTTILPVLGIVLVSCSDSTAPPLRSTVHGSVPEAGSDRPIEGAVVLVGAHSTTSAADGAYAVGRMRAGTYAIGAVRNGFADYSEQVVVADGAIRHDIHLARVEE